MGSSYDRHRDPSPSHKRRKRDYEERSHRNSSRDREDRYRHRSSSHRHSSSRYDDDRDRRSSRRESSRSRTHDNVSSADARSHAHQSHSSDTRKDGSVSRNLGSPPPEDPAKQAQAAAEATEDRQRKRQERIRIWKMEQEAKKAEERAKAEQEKEKTQQEQKGAEPQPEEKASETAAVTVEAPKAEETKAESVPKPETASKDVEMAEASREGADDTGKKWNLEDEDEEDDDAMQIDTTAKTEKEAERGFKPLNTQANEDESKDDLVSKPRVQAKSLFIMGKQKKTLTDTKKPEVKPSSTKPRMAMRIGLGNKNMIPKKTANGKTTDVKMAEAEPAAPQPTPAPAPAAADEEDEDVDPLEAYMQGVTAEAKKASEEDKKRLQEMQAPAKPTMASDDEDEGGDENEKGEDEYGSDPEDILAMAAKKVKRKDIAAVDHSKMDYEPFRKNFYIEPPELREMNQDQVNMLRFDLDDIKIRGVNCPKPVVKWTHCGLPAGCLEVIRKLKFDKPTSIQAQAIPAIMSGRDVIGVAKTGSGKTIAFLLPMFRHIKDQRPLEMGEGPIGVIMTPTRELATQIHRECKPFLKVLGLRAVCAYGGSPIKDQIADLKRGCEIIVCTPGRMIDLLTANSGRVTNLKRVTYMVLDEADRMFDMGFEPQVMKIVNNVRPSKQTVLFSATFPRQMEALARKVLKKPLEITVGGRSVVASDIEQHVEVREDSTKFIRLLEILGDFFNQEGDDDARALIFVDRHEAADNLLRDLIRRGYPCQSLHGGKDQADRDSTISDFKSGVSNILIATSVAARGLDVKQLKMVVNYECPNHMEDYVHRVGRTGRAGNKGIAYTFITPDQERYAIDISKALTASGQPIPDDLQQLVNEFKRKVETGEERFSGSGFGGKGLERFDKDRDLVKKIQKRAYGGEDMDESDEEEIELESRVVSGGTPTPAGTSEPQTPQAQKNLTPGQAAQAAQAAAASAAEAGKGGDEQHNAAAQAAKRAAAEVAARINAMVSKKTSANDVLSDINSRFTNATQSQDTEGRPVYAEEITINDYPQKARWRVTNKEQISQITEVSGAAITTRGTFFPPGKQPGPNERKLYLFIEGDSELVVEKAKTEIKRILMEATVAQLEADARTGGGGAGRYSVV